MRREAILDFLAGIVNDNGCSIDFFVLFGVAADAMPSNIPADIIQACLTLHQWSID